jgi:hypothetical protein
MDQENSTQKVDAKEKELFCEEAFEDDLELDAEVEIDELPL